MVTPGMHNIAHNKALPGHQRKGFATFERDVDLARDNNFNIHGVRLVHVRVVVMHHKAAFAHGCLQIQLAG